MSESEAQHTTDREACHVRPDIGALATEAQIDQQHDPSRQRRPTADPAAPWNDPASAHVPREDAQGTEESGRGADRGVTRRLNERVNRVPKRTCQKNGEPRQP